jgi:hypothetical protein
LKGGEIVEISNKDFGDLAIYALRYTFGRMTYAGDDVRKIIRNNIYELSKIDRSVIIKDVEDALGKHKRGFKIGSDTDKQSYEEFLDFLRSVKL